MSRRSPRDRPGLTTWLVSLVGLAVLLVVASLGPLGRTTWTSPHTLFWLVTVGAGACYVGALWTLVAGWRDAVAEVAILGAALMVQSCLALVHGLTAPGVLYGATSAVSTSVFLALPLALVVAAPLFVPGRPASRWVAQRWRAWTISWVVVAGGLAGALLVDPNGLPATQLGHPVAVVVGLLSVAAALRISWRLLGLYWLGRRRASLVAALAVGYLGLSGLVWLGDRAFSPGWWLAHVLDISGVLGASVALAAGHRQDRRITGILAPVLSRDPLVALQLGLAPVVHRFVADLHTKDPLTRDHVVRVAEMAMRAGERAALSPNRLRRLGLAAILHDIGKLTTPTEILTKPGRLTDTEMSHMRQHSIAGERLLADVPDLAMAAPLVRAHHERHDGAGYPDGLRGSEIPLEAALISVCDAFDAMAHTRHYREGMGPDRAVAILREHAGSQWNPVCVELVVGVIHDVAAGAVLWDVGRTEAETISGTGDGPTAEAPVCHALPSGH